MNTTELLTAARALIARECNWTVIEAARDSDALPVSPTASSACQWCALGAIDRAAFDASLLGSDKTTRAARTALQKQARQILVNHNRRTDSTSCPTIRLNDSLGHAAIIAAFDKAIADTQS